MEQKKSVEIEKITNPFEKDILLFLKNKNECIYGEIFKQLRISAAKGQEAIYSLLKQGLISHKEKSSIIKLNVEIK